MASDTYFFQTGGTLDEDSPSYIERPADGELLHALERGELCLILAPRQTGKSSLMCHAVARLKPMGIRAGIVDLQPLGSYNDLNVWFGGVVYSIGRSLGLKTNTAAWWNDHALLAPTQRFMTFMEEVVLREVSGRVVVFFDEIDSALSLPFSDDFFTTIRALFNARANNPALKRLNLVILGVARPSEFIKNRSRTPFNIGRMIELRDFEPSSLRPFKEALGPDSDHLVDRIFYWTAGQPMMVQNLTEKVYAQPPAERSDDFVDKAVQQAYLDTRVEKDTHLKFIRDYLVEDNKKLRNTLKTYRAVLEGKEASFNDQSPIHARLKLAGVVRVDNQKLAPRNRIYERVFGKKWVKENTPRDTVKIVAYSASSVLTLVLLWFLLLQPLLFPKFSRFQDLPWAENDVHYTEQTSLSIVKQLPLQHDRITRITLDNKEIPLNETSDKQREQTIQVLMNNLRVGASEHILRFYGGLWKENFETRLTIVSYPKAHWKPLHDLKMVTVEGKEYEMGCGDWDGECSEGEKLHRVFVDTFDIGQYEVTQEEWEGVMGYNPSFYNKGGRYPVECVSWDDVQEFIRRLNIVEEKAGMRFRLPTEAEWEFAARSGGKEQKYAGTSNKDDLYKYANLCDKNCSFEWKNEEQDDGFEHTAPVGSYRENGLLLYDMCGNVWEWCFDWYGDYDLSSPSPLKNPKGPESGSYRMVRGGSWCSGARSCRSAYRNYYAPGNRDDIVGFRLARSVNP